jgi:hypothetical protein
LREIWNILEAFEIQPNTESQKEKRKKNGDQETELNVEKLRPTSTLQKSTYIIAKIYGVWQCIEMPMSMVIDS